ncbi:MAG: hypothetical protein JRM80_07015 [Nitrososphaerota archaeon]|nr:hypothetical protein [Nitrososphaerota archaeon]MDG6990732.1 hypothetical protein [Nitrososphaerota archaeon]
MTVKAYLAGSLAVTGGALMLASGYSSRGFLYTALGYAEPRFSDFLSGVELGVAVVAVSVLELVIALGGLTVLIGGFMVILRHTTTGRVLIWLGGGAGFLGLLIGFGYSAYRLGGLGPVLAYLPYWVGLALAVTGRRLAKGT